MVLIVFEPLVAYIAPSLRESNVDLDSYYIESAEVGLDFLFMAMEND